MCPFWNWEQIRAWEIWEKWFGLRNIEEAPSSPQPLQFQSGVSSELGRALIRMGKDFWDQVELWSCFLGWVFRLAAFQCGKRSVRVGSCSAELQEAQPGNPQVTPKPASFTTELLFFPFLRRKNCSLMPGIVGSSWEIKVREKGALYSYFILRNSEVQRGHTAGHQD